MRQVFFAVVVCWASGGFARAQDTALVQVTVSWKTWETATLETARVAGKPLLVVVNDGSCFPCLSHEQALVGTGQTAELIDLHFVAIRVDRVDQPVLAEALSEAATLLADTPGVGTTWPLLLAATPDGRPFWAALPGLGAAPLQPVLGRLASDFFSDRAAIDVRAGMVLASVREQQRRDTHRAASPAALQKALSRLRRSLDPRFGGALPDPLRLPYGALRLLLAERRRSGDAAALELAARILETRAKTLQAAPRSRNLADTGLLLRALGQATAAGRDELRDATIRVADGVVKDLADREGGFDAGRLAQEGETEAKRDDRVIAGWNGLIIGGLATSGTAVGRPQDIEVARRAAERVLARLGPASQLRRTARGSTTQGSAVLEDYAYLAEGLLDLHEATKDLRWRSEASMLVDAAIVRFADSGRGGFFGSDAAHEPLPARLRDGFDGALPSANGVLASVLLRLGRLTGESRYTELGRRTVEAFLGDVEDGPGGTNTVAAALCDLLGPAKPQPVSEPAWPSRVARGPVTIDVMVVGDDPRAGEVIELRIRLAIADGWSVVAHDAGAAGFVPLSVSLPGEARLAGRPDYPPGTPVRGRFGGGSLGSVYLRQAAVAVPVRVPEVAGPVRMQIRYQPCDARQCQSPENVMLQAVVGPVAR